MSRPLLEGLAPWTPWETLAARGGGPGRGREWVLSGIWLVSAWMGEWQRDSSQREMETEKKEGRGTERKATSREPERDGGQSRGRGDSHGVGAQNTSSKKGHLS